MLLNHDGQARRNDHVHRHSEPPGESRHQPIGEEVESVEV